MPGYDRKGPNSEGSKTGRGLGRCNPETRDNIDLNEERPGRNQRLQSGSGDGLGRGQGAGRGAGRGAGQGAGRGAGRGLGRRR